MYKEAMILVTAVMLAAVGCQHKPVYPDYGSLYIASLPAGSEVLIDGVMTHQNTPVKIDGIGVGTHKLTLRHDEYKVLSLNVEVKAGETRRINATLSPITVSFSLKVLANISDICLSPSDGMMFTSSRGTNQVSSYSLTGSALSLLHSTDVGNTAMAIAAERNADRVYCLLGDSIINNTIASLYYSSLAIKSLIILPSDGHYNRVCLSPDGNWAVVADSLKKRLVVIDAQKDSITQLVSLTGIPTDVNFGPFGNILYVTQKDKRFAKIDIGSGSVLGWLPTGNNPMNIFWKNDNSVAGVCNSTDMNISLFDIGGWVDVSYANSVGGDFLTTACWSAEPVYLFASFSSYDSTGSLGTVSTIYLPNWGITLQYAAKLFFPQKMYKDLYGRYLFVLDKMGDVTAFQTDI